MGSGLRKAGRPLGHWAYIGESRASVWGQACATMGMRGLLSPAVWFTNGDSEALLHVQNYTYPQELCRHGPAISTRTCLDLSGSGEGDMSDQASSRHSDTDSTAWHRLRPSGLPQILLCCLYYIPVFYLSTHTLLPPPFTRHSRGRPAVFSRGRPAVAHTPPVSLSTPTRLFAFLARRRPAGASAETWGAEPTSGKSRGLQAFPQSAPRGGGRVGYPSDPVHGGRRR